MVDYLLVVTMLLGKRYLTTVKPVSFAQKYFDLRSQILPDVSVVEVLSVKVAKEKLKSVKAVSADLRP